MDLAHEDGTRVETLPVRIENVGPVERLDFELKPGVLELTGRNGSGKSASIRAVLRAAGVEDAELALRDGAETGLVETPWIRVLVTQAAVEAESFDTEVRPDLASGEAIARLIDPQLKTPELAHNARIRAFVELVKLSLGRESTAHLCGADETLTRELRLAVAADEVVDAISAQEWVRQRAHELARGHKSEADQARGERDGALRAMEARLEELGGAELDIDPAEAERTARQLADRLAEQRVRREARERLEARQAEIRASLGAEPDVLGAEVEVSRRTDSVRDLERRLAEARAELHQAETTLRERRAARDLWKDQQRILDQEADGPTLEEVQALEVQVERYRDRARRARLSAEARQFEAEATAAVGRAELADQAETQYRKLARSVTQRLADLLQDAGAAGWSVQEGQLYLHLPGRATSEPFARLSDGERARAALELTARRYSGRLVAIPAHFWGALDPQRRAEMRELFQELKLYGLTELPTTGELGVQEVH